LDFKTLPSFVRTGQDAEMKIGFVDEKAKKSVNHVTFIMDISKDGKIFFQNFSTVTRER
jgi:predicted DNA-binding helix-hairpin-helix protein